MSEIRQHAHQGLVKFLETIVDPAIDDEPETDEELKAVQEAKNWLLRNGDKGIDHKEAMRRLGLE